MTIKGKNRQFKNLVGFVLDILKVSKIKVIIISSVILITFLTGIIVAIKTQANYDNLESLGVVCFGNNAFNTSFFSRLLSMLLIAIICFGCSFTDYLLPVATLFLAYRGYLLGVNICLIIAVNGIGGIIFSILIILPCQIIALFLLAIFYILMAKTNKDLRCFGGCRVPNQKMKIVLSIIISLVLICVLEALLLAVFSPKVILVL